MTKKRRAATRSYRISVDAKPKKIKPSVVQNEVTSTVGNDLQNSGQLQPLLNPHPSLDAPPSSLKPSTPVALEDAALTRPGSNDGPINPDIGNESASIPSAPHVLRQANPSAMTVSQGHTVGISNTFDDVEENQHKNYAEAADLKGADHSLFEGRTDEDVVHEASKMNDDQAARNFDSFTDSLMVFSCAQCHRTVSDSSTGYNFNGDKTLLSVRGAQSVKISDKLEVSTSGPDVQCTFHVVTCTQCGSRLGKVYSSTSRHFDHHRDVFTFDTGRLKTYCVGDLRTPSGEDVSSLATKLPLLTPLSTNAPTLDAFEDLDAHVNTVTDAVNNVTDAIRDLRRAILDIRAELNTTKTKVNEGEDALSKLHNVVSLWESRHRKSQTGEHQLAPIIPMLRSMEKRLRLVENKVTPVFTAKVPQITDASHTPSLGNTTLNNQKSVSPTSTPR